MNQSTGDDFALGGVRRKLGMVDDRERVRCRLGEDAQERSPNLVVEGPGEEEENLVGAATPDESAQEFARSSGEVYSREREGFNCDVRAGAVCRVSVEDQAERVALLAIRKLIDSSLNSSLALSLQIQICSSQQEQSESTHSARSIPTKPW